MGDHLVVLNAEKIKVTGAKLTDKFYHHHTGYMGNLKSIALGKLLKEHPERAIQFAVKGMLPKNTLGRQMYRKLHVFAGAKHPHQAQQPKSLESVSAGYINDGSRDATTAPAAARPPPPACT